MWSFNINCHASCFLAWLCVYTFCSCIKCWLWVFDIFTYVLFTVSLTWKIAIEIKSLFLLLLKFLGCQREEECGHTDKEGLPSRIVVRGNPFKDSCLGGVV